MYSEGSTTRHLFLLKEEAQDLESALAAAKDSMALCTALAILLYLGVELRLHLGYLMKSP